MEDRDQNMARLLLYTKILTKQELQSSAKAVRKKEGENEKLQNFF